VTGAAWAAVSGIGFGIFQVLNARALRNVTQVYVATFAQLLSATSVFAVLVLSAGSAGSLAEIPLKSLVLFALAGIIHFFLGWTTLNASHARIGAARTSPLIAMTPIFGVLIALATTGSLPGPLALLGIAVTVVGAYLVSDPRSQRRASLRDCGFGLATAAAWAVSAVLTVAALRAFDDPLLGVTIGLAAAAVPYGVVLVAAPATRGGRIGRAGWGLKILAGVVVAFATWWRYLGLADAPVGVVLALQLLTVPTVLTIVALTPGGERVSAPLWLGSGLVLAGVLLLITVS
jgi:drug/metabolite transporter (DMT)-like permease